jgi:hypothetical protein
LASAPARLEGLIGEHRFHQAARRDPGAQRSAEAPRLQKPQLAGKQHRVQEEKWFGASTFEKKHPLLATRRVPLPWYGGSIGNSGWCWQTDPDKKRP